MCFSTSNTEKGNKNTTRRGAFLRNYDNKRNQTRKEKSLAERGFDPRTSGLWAQHASTAPLCYRQITCSNYLAMYLACFPLVAAQYM